MRASPFVPLIVAAVMSAIVSIPPLHADVFYVPDVTGDTITRVNNAGAKNAVVDTGLVTPQQVAVDAAGDFYVADSGVGKVLKYPSAGGAPTQVGNDVPELSALAFDANGILHVASLSDDSIRKLTSGTFQLLATVTGSPRSIAFAPDGSLAVADATGNRVVEVKPDGSQSVISEDLTAPFAVAFDRAGKLHVTDTESGGRIANFAGKNVGNNSKNMITGLGDVRGLAFDKGNVAHYLTGAGELRKVTGNSSTELVASGLGDPQLLTSRGATTTVIAYKGQPVSEPSSAVFSSLGSPAIGGGFVAFKGSLLPPAGSVSSANALGLWRSDSNGALQLLARKGFPLPTNTNFVFTNFGDPVVNESGNVAFLGTLRTGLPGVTAANATGIFSDVGGQPLRPVLRKGDPAPGSNLDPEVKFTAFKQIVLPNDSGPAVLATIAGPGVNSGNNLGLWSSDPAGTFSLVARKGDTINVGGISRKLTTLGIFTPTRYSLGQARHFGDDGNFIFHAKFSDGFTAILHAKAGSTPTVLAEKLGDVGTDIPGAKFATLGSPAMNADANAAAFLAKLVPNLGGVTPASAAALFVHTTGNDLTARNTFAAPDVTGGTFALLSDPVMSPTGGTAFFAKLKPGLGDVLSSTAAGLWQDVGVGVVLAARQGSPVSGVNGNPVFTSFKQFVLPATGGVVFTATIAGGGVTSANNLGLWANDGAGGTEILLRKGDKLEIGGNQKTVTAFKIFTKLLGVAGQSRHFDHGGTVACHVKCSDGTQAILAFRRP
jgi:hypothetical protein